MIVSMVGLGFKIQNKGGGGPVLGKKDKYFGHVDL